VKIEHLNRILESVIDQDGVVMVRDRRTGEEYKLGKIGVEANGDIELEITTFPDSTIEDKSK
jgi:hypothetical protein